VKRLQVHLHAQFTVQLFPLHVSHVSSCSDMLVDFRAVCVILIAVIVMFEVVKCQLVFRK